MDRPFIPERESATRRLDFGDVGIVLLEYLCDPRFSHDAPLRGDDLQALADVEELYRYAARLFDPLLDADPAYELVDRYAAKWLQFQTALPFSEGERAWFLHVDYDLEPDDSPDEEGDKLSRQRGYIVDAGVQRIVSGHELLHRWLAWRRETDQFKGQGTLDLARHVLVNLVEVVSPESAIPESARPFK
jgi:hypothetical protein